MNLINKVIYRMTLQNNNLNRKFAFAKSIDFQMNNRIEGAFIEFGVGRGETLKIFLEASFVKNYQYSLAIGVDTFEGFPDTYGPEKLNKFNNIELGSRNATIKQILRKLRKYRNLKLIKTNLETDNFKLDDILQSSQKIGIAHFDLDYYEPTIKALTNLKKHFQIGSILLFDNYYYFRGYSKLGEQLALSEFRELYPNTQIINYFQYGWHGQAFIISDLQSNEPYEH
jgi:hypothetical protein